MSSGTSPCFLAFLRDGVWPAMECDLPFNISEFFYFLVLQDSVSLWCPLCHTASYIIMRWHTSKAYHSTWANWAICYWEVLNKPLLYYLGQGNFKIFSWNYIPLPSLIVNVSGKPEVSSISKSCTQFTCLAVIKPLVLDWIQMKIISGGAALN